MTVEPNLSVGIVGVGVLGGAVRAYFESRGVLPKLFDKYTGIGSVAQVNEADTIFVCVPTPYVEGKGFDATAVTESIACLEGSKTVLVKSTLLPGTTETIQVSFPQHRIFFQPEFLREKTALEDFLAPDRQIIGFCRDAEELARSLLLLLPRAPYEAVMPATAAELVKMAGNSFLAMKVIFANQIFDLCQTLDVDYGAVQAGLGADPRLGKSHLEIFDQGYRGYGGKCLPKDTRGLIDLADQVGEPLELLKEVHRINESLTASRRVLNALRPTG